MVSTPGYFLNPFCLSVCALACFAPTWAICSSRLNSNVEWVSVQKPAFSLTTGPSCGRLRGVSEPLMNVMRCNYRLTLNSASGMTDKELHIPRNSGERNQPAEKSFLNSRQPACTAESIRKRTCSEKFGILWKFFPKSKKQFKLSCWPGRASDLMRRADISVLVPTQLWVVLRDENNLHYPQWTSASSAFIKNNPFKSLYREAVCK